MAKIVQVITRPAREYDLPTAEAQVRDLDAIVEKLNSTFQEELKTHHPLYMLQYLWLDLLLLFVG